METKFLSLLAARKNNTVEVEEELKVAEEIAHDHKFVIVLRNVAMTVTELSFQSQDIAEQADIIIKNAINRTPRQQQNNQYKQ